MAIPLTGGNLLPNRQQPAATAAPAPANSLQNYFAPTAAPFAGRNYNDLVGGSLEYFMNPNSALMQQAAQRGREVAATRGGINSSIAAGNAQREVLDAAGNLAQGAVNAQLSQEQAQLNDWMDQQGFNRQLAAMPYQSSMNMLERVSQYALEDPQLYTPSVVSGFNNFFNQNMNDILARYFNG